MFAKKTDVALTLTLSLVAIGAAHAQTATFGVDALASTTGFPGTYHDDPAAVPGGVSLSASSDPAYVQFDNGYGLLAADAAAHATANAHRLSASVYAFADRISATAFTNSSPQANTESRWYDYITVRSDSLPVGTPVEIVFRSSLSTGFNAAGGYSGSLYAELRVGAYSASTTSSYHYNGSTEVPGPEIRVKAKVGDRLALNSKLRAGARAYYYSTGPGFDGEISIGSTATIEMDPGNQDVWVEYDSDN